ncbi:MAG: TonB-dependent receptor [Bacteroidia bacterium]|nr:TonB-dependent receptor [Bacteroidia bacterium]
MEVMLNFNQFRVVFYKVLTPFAIVFILFNLTGNDLRAQVSDTALVPRNLGYNDIDTVRREKKKEISGGSRIPIYQDELPARTIIISKEEIQRNGYSSLTDVLKSVPGFRVSQPGSAELGETFLMRGLVGNIYTKILINGVPIRPSAAPGLPLGAQLPIRQAERIEIIIGPNSSLYGNDAMAGVINIVLPEVERPLEATASLGFGNTWRDEIHLFLGGKTGKKKNVFKYRLYASAKRMQDVTMRLDTAFLTVDSVAATINDFHGEDGVAFTNNMGHESRLLGIEVNWQGFTLTTQSFYRKDHAALGSSPSEIAYDNPNNFVAEAIRNHKLTYAKEFGNFGIISNLSYLLYTQDPNSSFTAVLHPLAASMNFTYAKSRDLLAEQMFTYSLKRFKFLAGAVYQRRSGTAYQAYLLNPYNPRIVHDDSTGNFQTVPTTGANGSNLTPLSPFNMYTFNDFGFFAQTWYSSPKFNFVLGLRADKAGLIPHPTAEEKTKDDFALSPRVGILWKPAKWIRFRGQFAQAFRVPAPYYRFNNYRGSSNVLPDPQNQNLPPQLWMWRNTYTRTEQLLKPEKLTSIEAGTSILITKGLTLHLHYFNQTLKNSLFPVLDSIRPIQPGPVPLDVDTMALIGFSNADSKSKLQGFQARLQLDVEWFAAEIGAQMNVGSESIVTVKKGVPTTIVVNGYRSVPGFMLNANFHFDFPEVFYFSIYGQYYSSFIRSAVIAYNEEINEKTTGYYNIDFTLGRRIVKRLDGFVKLTNLTNTVTKGIYTNSITGYNMDYVPQTKFMFLLGLNFELN